jgi:glyoxylase-like metal-dependent hydrolase (beta-lactamase superfamily II)
MARGEPHHVQFPVPTNTGTGELRLRVGTLELIGTSISALATAFVVDDLKTAIDMGRCTALLAEQETVLLTHCHSDHVAGLVAWLSAHTRRYRGSPTTIVMPTDRRQQLLDALQVWPDLDGVRRRVDLADSLIGARPGDTVALARGGWARCFRMHHSTAALGWAVGAAGTERPWFVFAGDGTVLPFADDPDLLDATIAVVDCSFLDTGTRVAARLGGHGHLQDWIELLPVLRCDALVLAHLPAEATADQITRLVGNIEEGPLIVPWLDPGRR